MTDEELWKEYCKAENGNQRFFVACYGMTVEEAKKCEDNLRKAFEKALQRKKDESVT